MRRRLIAAAAVAAVALPIALIPGGASASHGRHEFWILGESTIQNQHEYVWASPTEWDNGPSGTAAFGIPRPSTLPPTHLTSQPCDIARNTGPLGLNPPCAGTLTHTTLAGNQGCTEITNPAAPCSFTGGSTWYYGFCGQTYGGASGIIFQFSGETWQIDKMGFRRPSGGVWEFNGKMTRLSPSPSQTGYIQMYLTAIPNKADEAGACDLTHNLTSIYFQGRAIVTTTPQQKLFAPKPGGWYWCDGTDGC